MLSTQLTNTPVHTNKTIGNNNVRVCTPKMASRQLTNTPSQVPYFLVSFLGSPPCSYNSGGDGGDLLDVTSGGRSDNIAVGFAVVVVCENLLSAASTINGADNAASHFATKAQQECDNKVTTT
jgi:hypothetical protein